MKVTLSTDAVSVEVECEGGYQPDILLDICNRARELVKQAQADLEEDANPGEDEP